MKNKAITAGSIAAPGPMVLASAKVVEGFDVSDAMVDDIKNGRVGVMDHYYKPGQITIFNDARAMVLSSKDLLPGDAVVNMIKIAGTRQNFEMLSYKLSKQYEVFLQAKNKFIETRPKHGRITVSDTSGNVYGSDIVEQPNNMSLLNFYRKFLIEINDNVFMLSDVIWRPCINNIKSVIDAHYHALYTLEGVVALKQQIAFHEPTYILLNWNLRDVIKSFNQDNWLFKVTDLMFLGI
uniref:hypothetical protein n=1 Tax=Aspergillus sclerotioniger TaxID=319627 RepID=UPI0021153399|nr:hypothetical protein NQV51_mgp24 [Aspergillus sclerotioniger]USH57630.1 hypothetical protein [Aspergillus sclerotioniger]